MEPERRKDIIFYSIIFTLIAGALCLLLWLRAAETAGDRSEGDSLFGTLGERTEILSVTIEGAVLYPGTYYLNDGAFVADLLELAGGFRSDAETAEIDLSASLTDGQVVWVRVKDSAAAAEEYKLNINTASATELEQLPDIGPMLAASIITYRDEHGPFLRTEELMNVPGIGEKRYESLKDHIKAE